MCHCLQRREFGSRHTDDNSEHEKAFGILPNIICKYEGRYKLQVYFPT